MTQDYWEPFSQQGAGEVWAMLTTALDAAYPATQVIRLILSWSGDIRRPPYLYYSILHHRTLWWYYDFMGKYTGQEFPSICRRQIPPATSRCWLEMWSSVALTYDRPATVSSGSVVATCGCGSTEWQRVFLCVPRNIRNSPGDSVSAL